MPVLCELCRKNPAVCKSAWNRYVCLECQIEEEAVSVIDLEE